MAENSAETPAKTTAMATSNPKGMSQHRVCGGRLEFAIWDLAAKTWHWFPAIPPRCIRMNKADRITRFVQQLGASPDSPLDPHYQGFFQCFNEQRYYEAHDVLEHLWLQNRDENH